MGSDLGNGVGFRTPGGWSGWASGRDVVLIVVMLASVAGLGWTIHTGTTVIEKGLAQQAASMLDQRSEHAALAQGNRELVCILALDGGYRLLALQTAERPGGSVCGFALSLMPAQGVTPRAR